MRVVGYVRVSSESQLDGYGLDVQRKAIRVWAKANGHTVMRIEEDAGMSGAKDAADRPGLTAALEALREREAAGLVVARLDRLARALHVQEAALEVAWQAGATVYAVDQGEVQKDDPDDPMRDAIRKMQGVFAELDRKLVVKRLRDGQRAKAAAGRKATGDYPFGYKGGGVGRQRDAVKDATEQKVIRRLVALREGGLTFEQVARALDSEGAKTRDGGPWRASSVYKIYRRERADVSMRPRTTDERLAQARIIDLRTGGLSFRQIAAQLDLEGIKPKRADSWSPMGVRAILATTQSLR